MLSISQVCLCIICKSVKRCDWCVVGGSLWEMKPDLSCVFLACSAASMFRPQGQFRGRPESELDCEL